MATRFTAVFVAAATVLALSSACATKPDSPPPPPPTSATVTATADCSGASGLGDVFVSTFLSDLSAKAAQANPPKTVATSALDLGGHPARYFNIPLAMDGYLAAIVYKAAGAPEDTARDAMGKVLANLPR